MTRILSNKRAQGGSALAAVLILLVLAAGAGAWFYFKKDLNALPPEEAITSTTEVPVETDFSAETPQEPIAPADSAATEPSDLTTDATTSATPAGPVDVAKAMGVRAIGNPDAPIKIIEYASLTCSHCAHFHNDILPAMKTKYIDTGKVYLEFREFPLNDPALKATITARCLPEERYEGFIGLLFKSQAQWSEGIDYMSHLKQNAKLAGLSDEQFEACQQSGPLKEAIAANMQEAQDKYEVASTPTFVINDGAKKVSGAQPLENFEQVFRDLTNNAVGEAPKVE